MPRRLQARFLIATLAIAFAGSRAARADLQYALSSASSQFEAAQVGTTFREKIAVRVALWSDFTVGVTNYPVTFTAPASGASGTFATTGTNAVTVLSDSRGIATAPDFTANTTPGTYVVSITTTDATPNIVSFTNTLHSPDSPTLISTGNGSNQSAMINTAFATRLSAAVFNGFNQHVGGVTVTFTAPDSGASGTFAASGTNTTSVVTGFTGVATASVFTANGTTGSYVVTATISGDQTATGQPISTTFALRNSLTNVKGAPDVVSAAAGNGQNAPVLTPFATNMQVVVLDGDLNYVAGATVTFTAPASGASGTFPAGGTTFTTTSGPTGLADAPTFTANAIVGGYGVTVTATKNGVTATGAIGLSNGRVKTSTTLADAPAGTSVYGQQVKLTATVAALEGTLAPAGPVAFKSGGSAMESCTSINATGGVATCTLDLLSLGTYSFSADYLGDEVSQPSASTSVSHTVTKADTAVALVSSAPDFALAGNSVTFTATLIVVSPGAGTPTGGIVFTSSDGTPLNGGALVALSGTSAQVTTSALTTGDRTITAAYAGDSNFNGSSNALTQHVDTVPQVTTDPTSQQVLAGATATFTAAANGVPIPTVQWQVRPPGGTFADLPGATSTTLSFTATAGDDQKQYRAVFTSPAGAATSAAVTLTVTKVSQAALTVTVTPAGGVFGDKLTLGTIGGSGSGAVSFDVGGSTACALGTGADAGKLLITDGTGTCAVTATKAGDAIYNSATSAPVSVPVSKAATSLSVASVSLTVGSPTALPATLTRSSGGAPVSGQRVSFTLNGMSVGSATTDGSGVATLVSGGVRGLTNGVYPTGVGASYAGDSRFTASAGTGSLTVGTVAAPKPPTTTALTSSLNPSTAGQAVTFTAQVSPGSATGTVTFLDGSRVLGINALDATGKAIYTSSALANGTHQVTAQYGGDASNAPSYASAIAQVVGSSTSFTLTVTKAGAGSGTVTSTPAGIACGATCTMSFASGTLVTLTAQAAPGSVFTGWSGDCGRSCALAMTADHNVTATFAPAATARTATTTTLTSSTNPSTAGQPVTLTGQVSAGAATGTVTFMDGRTVLGTATLVGGVATLTTSALAPGHHAIIAIYGGDASYAGSTSASLDQNVGP